MQADKDSSSHWNIASLAPPNSQHSESLPSATSTDSPVQKKEAKKSTSVKYSAEVRIFKTAAEREINACHRLFKSTLEGTKTAENPLIKLENSQVKVSKLGPEFIQSQGKQAPDKAIEFCNSLFKVIQAAVKAGIANPKEIENMREFIADALKELPADKLNELSDPVIYFKIMQANKEVGELVLTNPSAVSAFATLLSKETEIEEELIKTLDHLPNEVFIKVAEKMSPQLLEACLKYKMENPTSSLEDKLRLLQGMQTLLKTDTEKFLIQVMHAACKIAKPAEWENIVKDSLTSPELKNEALICLAIKDFSILETILEDIDESDVATRLLVLSKFFAQSDNLEALEENDQLLEIIASNLEMGVTSDNLELQQEALNILSTMGSRAPTFTTAFTMTIFEPQLMKFLSSPKGMAAQKNAGYGGSFASEVGKWSNEQKKEFFAELFKDPSNYQLALERLNELPSGDAALKVEIIQANLGKITLDQALQVLGGDPGVLEYLKSDKHDSLLLKTLSQFNLNDIKKADEHMQKQAISLIIGSIKEEALRKWAEEMLEKAKGSYETTKEILAFAYFLDHSRKFEGDLDKWVSENKKILPNLLNIGKPSQARFFLIEQMFEDKDIHSLFTPYLDKKSDNLSILALKMQLFSYEVGIEETFGEENAIRKTQNYAPIILEALSLIRNNSFLTDEDKKFLIRFATDIPSSKNTKAEAAKYIKQNLTLIISILKSPHSACLQKESLLSGDDPQVVLRKLAGQIFIKTISGTNSGLRAEDAAILIEKLNESRDPDMIINLVAKLNQLPNKEVYLNKLTEFLNEFVKGDFPSTRYLKSPHLQALFQKKTTDTLNLVGWSSKVVEKQTLKDVLKGQEGKYKDFEIFETDDLTDLLNMGTEVQGSCLSLLKGGAQDVKDLLGNVFDGKTKMLCIKKSENPSEPLLGRVCLKLLWDDTQQTPVLLQEGIHLNTPNQEDQLVLEKALCQASIQMATALNIPLVCGRTAELPLENPTEDYPNPVESLDANRAPSEKCDPLDQQLKSEEDDKKVDIRYERRNQEQTAAGNYALMRTKLIWPPSK
ncbi:hypothetical protein [Parachlamydia sp. AcF125]|uniref:hypothetical protein n=1 Tax=Parachlamydia sp. AcF125 TaxID=2795736 RepID=UPI001BC94BC0|nr:hypothetical protein [Parachlamydia sp. AcF125]MBS4167548.1 hypothetical protein [Parachlamydia sp. AcF125]